MTINPKTDGVKKLEVYFFEAAKGLKLKMRFIFQQDSPKHKAEATREFFGSFDQRIVNPDLKAIKNLKQDLKIHPHCHSPSNLTELELLLSIPQETCSRNCCERWVFKGLT